MLIAEIIKKKRDRLKLNAEEIGAIVEGAARGTVPDYQLSAWLMASFLNGLDFEECLALTSAIKDSGKHLNWSSLKNTNGEQVFCVDKHSTGGVGDKVSLVLAPLVACFGLKVPMMSGRGLGFTGGTVDKLESIPGFSMYPDHEKMIEALKKVGTVMTAQAQWLCPADKKLYALRDVTSTVENISLITASIVSKKWAEGVHGIIFDVKCGNGAFMSNLESAKKLAESLVRVAQLAGMKAKACITRMDEPLGAYVGNALEVKESLSILKNSYDSPLHKKIAQPLKDLCLRLSAEMVLISGQEKNLSDALAKAQEYLESQQALKVFYEMAFFQGAHKDWEKNLATSKNIYEFKSRKSGFVKTISSHHLGILGQEIGVGRKTMEDTIHPEAGFEILKMVGDKVESHEVLMKVHLPEKLPISDVHISYLEQVFGLSAEPVTELSPLYMEGVE